MNFENAVSFQMQRVKFKVFEAAKTAKAAKTHDSVGIQ